jgi:hypothetical protein
MTAGMVSVDAAGCVPPLQQTRIAAFLMSAHAAQARRVAMALPGPLRTAWQVELHGQFSREMETLSLLARATSWTFDPALPLLAWEWELAWLPQPVHDISEMQTAALIDTAAFGHALHASIRPAAVLPPNAALLDPFAAALHRIEAESSRLLQAQIVFLKSPQLAAVREAVEQAVGFRHTQIRGLWQAMLSGLGQASPSSNLT